MNKDVSKPFQRFWALLRPDRRDIRDIYLFAIVGGVLSLGLPLGIQAIINFVQAGVSSFINCEKVNRAYFLKEIGDSILFIFTHASDIVKWHEAFNSKLSELSKVIDEPYEIRTCVHLGEVCLHDANPLCLSVSETFKMEKQVRAGKIVFSDLAAKVAAPTLNGSSFKLVPYNSISIMQELRFKNATS